MVNVEGRNQHGGKLGWSPSSDEYPERNRLTMILGSARHG